MKGTNLNKIIRLGSKLRLRASGNRGGQAAVEFALVLTVAMIVLFVAIQFALIGQAALALGQMNYQGARFAAVNVCAQPSDVASYMCSVGSPTITKNSGSNLTITVNGSSGTVSSCSAPSVSSSCSNPRSLGSSVTVNVTFNMAGAGGILFLQSPFLGVSFPTTLSSTETAMSE
jgi:Flp pilus assembly protein TadG